jgi:hypoxanthine phosphoribosyltransferase
MNKENNPTWFSDDVIEIINKKRSCRDYTTTVLKMITTRCETGFPKWNDFIKMLELEAQRLPRVDYIVGITSGGWIIANILCRIWKREESCIKLKYTRYNDINTSSKGIKYFQGKKTSTITPDWTSIDHEITMSISPDKLINKSCLLVDDTIGSGATINVCKNYLEGCRTSHVSTYIVCAVKPKLADFYYTNKHFIIYPWGLDV